MSRQPESTSSQRRILAAERSARCLELRKRGYSMGDIAAALGIGKTTVKKALDKALATLRYEGAEDVRKLELARLDRLFIKVYQQATEGNHGAVDRCLKIMELRAKYVGLDTDPDKMRTAEERASEIFAALRKMDSLTIGEKP